MSRQVLSALLVLVFVASSCGGGGDSASDQATVATTTTTPSATTTASATTTPSSETHRLVATVVEAFCVGLISQYHELRELDSDLFPLSLFEEGFGIDYQLTDCSVEFQEGEQLYDDYQLGRSFDDPIASGYLTGCVLPLIVAQEEAQAR